MGSLSVVAVPVYFDLRESARQASHVAAMSALAVAARQAKAIWMVRGTGGAQLNLPGYGDGTLDYNSVGLPVGTSIASTAGIDGVLPDAHCRELLNALVPGLRVYAHGDSLSTTKGYDYYVHSGAGTVAWCTLHALDANGNLQVTPGGWFRHAWIMLGAASTWPRGTVGVWYANAADSAYTGYAIGEP